jgi:enoyl-[acyl-carrier protein] reductase I
MGLLDGKKALVFGVANDHSIAWGIAQALHGGRRRGVLVGSSLIEYVRRLPSVSASFQEPCDVRRQQITGARGVGTP